MTACISMFHMLPPCRWSSGRSFPQKQLKVQRCLQLLVQNDHNPIPLAVTLRSEFQPSFCSIFSSSFIGACKASSDFVHFVQYVEELKEKHRKM